MYYIDSTTQHISEFAYDLDTGITPNHTDFGGRASVGYDSVGDGRNDVSMIAWAGLGVAVDGSPPEVIAKLDWWA